RDDVLHALAGIAGQLFREIAQHLGRQDPAHLGEIAAGPGLLNRGMNTLEAFRSASPTVVSRPRKRAAAGAAAAPSERGRGPPPAVAKRLPNSSWTRKKITPPIISSVRRKPSPGPTPPKWLNSTEPRNPPARPAR